MSEHSDYIIIWKTVDGNMRSDYFLTIETTSKYYRVVPDYVHMCKNPRKSMLSFMEELPLLEVYIRKWKAGETI